MNVILRTFLQLECLAKQSVAIVGEEKSKFCIFGFLLNGIFSPHPKLEMLGNHKRGLDRSYQLETQVTFYTSYLQRTKLLNIFFQHIFERRQICKNNNIAFSSR